MIRRTMLGLLAAAAIAGQAVMAQAETVLRVTLQLPIKHHLGQNMLDFKKEVEAKTNGEIKIEIYPSAQLYKDKEVPQAVSSGAIEMGIASLTRFAGTIPAVDIFYVPFMFDSQEKVKKATAPESPIRKALDEAILNTGARVLWWQAFGQAIVLSKKKPIRLPEDMKGLKVRVFGKTIGETVKVLGGSPVLMSGSKQFLAYQRGAVDAGMTGITAVKSRKLYEVMDYLPLPRHADIEFIVIINEKVWQGLKPEHRKIIMTAARRVEKELRDKMNAIENQALEDIRPKIKVIDLTEEERDKWRKATRPVVDAYIKNAGELGRKLVDMAGKL
ncbi:TRAP transporter substrate-binding protein DctP [Thermopetrobacter sp. TC1]|uniref:TRAP transporter substrate-binding protein n=1 Tax=Thermopetrobacter sp. TC1 TaxID=1495045 RepID=UPI00056F8574|nr:TRAP transporter substrate-binding protein DctP [Thermopetrobacter sp. TC1]